MYRNYSWIEVFWQNGDVKITVGVVISREEYIFVEFNSLV